MCVQVGRADVPAIEAAFEAVDALAITSEAASGEWIAHEPADESRPLWNQVRVSALFPADIDRLAIERQVAELGPPGLEASWTEVAAEDWAALLKAQFRAQFFPPSLWVGPHWDPPPADGSARVVLDPGRAFGTGSHATTRLCLAYLSERALEPPFPSDVLDYGCGSGILAIAALALGARHATAIDLDPEALKVTRENADANGCTARLTTALPGAVPRAAFALVIANILAGPLIDLAPILRGALAPGATLLLSGITHAQSDLVKAAYRGLHFAERVCEDWSLLVARAP